jgi:acetoin utilization deacetylase AcuC-like enzyme
LINNLQKEQDNNFDYIFRKCLPNIKDVFKYFELIKKNNFSKEYIGSLLADNNDWKIVGALADLDNIYKGVLETVEKNETAYFLLNTGGHHADNEHYELFCPLNQLFFITEFLNYYDNFPSIYWLDLDAHFGNGDKILFDKYKQKMSHETNNLSGISVHNDGPNIDEDLYRGINHPTDISNEEYLKLIGEKITIPKDTKYCIVFIGTDIVNTDYGDNKNITDSVFQDILLKLKKVVNETGCKLLIFQTGGSNSKEIKTLIEALKSI